MAQKFANKNGSTFSAVDDDAHDASVAIFPTVLFLDLHYFYYYSYYFTWATLAKLGNPETKLFVSIESSSSPPAVSYPLVSHVCCTVCSTTYNQQLWTPPRGAVQT